ncbi:MAG: hypothetical protein ACTSRZ_06995 [Promethearchaeota archaeon]
MNLILILIILLLTFSIAMILFPTSYSIKINQISELGGKFYNPKGYVIFNIGLILSGLLLIPCCMFFRRSLNLSAIKSKIILIFTKLGIIFLNISAIGFSLVGIFRADWIYSMHIVAAIMAIGGIIFSAIFLLPIFIIKSKTLKKFSSNESTSGSSNIRSGDLSWYIFVLIAMYGYLIFIAIFTIVEVGLPILEKIIAGTYANQWYPLLWPLCEWNIFFATIIFLIGSLVFSLKLKEKNNS